MKKSEKIRCKKNKKRGISLVSLVIAIVVILVIAMIAFSNSTTMIDEANYSTLTSDIDEIKMVLDEKVAIMQGELVAQKKPIKKEQIYNYIAKGGATEDDFLKVEELPAYTIIEDLAKLGADVSDRVSESSKGNLLAVKYAVTQEGEIFIWPPYDYNGDLLVTPDDKIDDINQNEIVINGEKIPINVNEETGEIEEGPVISEPEVEDEVVEPDVADHEHDFRMQVTTDEYLASNATCQELATYYYKCTYCDRKGEDTYPYGELQSHLYSAYTTTKEPTCSETGLKVAQCIYCDDVKEATIEIKPDRHMSSDTRTAIAATCTETGLLEYFCPDCGVVTDTGTIPALGHIYKGQVTTQPACTTDGIKTFTCEACQDTYTQSIAKLGHKLVKDAAVKPTCTTTGLTEGSHCSTCKGIIVAQNVVPANGHSPTPVAAIAATCTTDGLTEGSKCSVCRAILKEQTKVAAKGHSPINAGTATVHTRCGACGITLSTSHSYSTSVASAATCTTKGTTKYACSCGYSYTKQDIDINGNNHTGSIVNGGTSAAHTKYNCCGKVVSTQHTYTHSTIAPTCTAQGYQKHACGCGYSYNTDYVASLGHTFNAITDLHCSRCGAQVYTAYALDPKDYQNKTGIDITSGYVEIPATFSAGGVQYKVTSIKDHAFVRGFFTNGSNDTLISIVLPDSITSIGGSAFGDCKGLRNVWLPKNLTSIGEQCFRYCYALSSIDFTHCTKLTSLANNIFSHAGLTTIKLPPNLQSIPEYAFFGCGSLTAIDMSVCKNLTSIGGAAFGGCVSLSSIKFPDSLVSIGRSAFQGNIGDSIWDGVESNNATSLVLPVSVRSIDYQAFSGCGNVSVLTYKGSVSQWNSISLADGWDTGFGAEYVQCTDGTVDLSPVNGCFALGTLITLADGTQKPIEEIISSLRRSGVGLK